MAPSWKKVKAARDALAAFRETGNGRGTCCCGTTKEDHTGFEHAYTDSHDFALRLLEKEVEDRRAEYNGVMREYRKTAKWKEYNREAQAAWRSKNLEKSRERARLHAANKREEKKIASGRSQLSTVREHLGLLWLLRDKLKTSNPQYDAHWAAQASLFVGAHLDELVSMAGGADVEPSVRALFGSIPDEFPHIVGDSWQKKSGR